MTWPVRVDPLGVMGPTRAQARSRRYRRSSRGLYVPADVDGQRVEQRVVEAAAVIPSGGGAVTGWAALAWRGGRWFSGRDPAGQPIPVELAMWTDIRPQRGFRVCHEGIDPREVELVDGLPLTSPVRSLCFLMRYAADVRSAVVHADMAAYDDLVSRDELAVYAAAHSAWTGIPQCRAGIALMDEHAWSPMETRTRLVWEVEADLPPLRTNVPVFDRQGRHVATPDLLDEESGLAIEYDGEVHLDADRRLRDRDRGEKLAAVGLHTLLVLGGDVADRDRLAARMRRARSRAPWLLPSDRAWTTDPPAWWTPTRTVALRRTLTAEQRSRLLRYRAA